MAGGKRSSAAQGSATAEGSAALEDVLPSGAAFCAVCMRPGIGGAAKRFEERERVLVCTSCGHGAHARCLGLVSKTPQTSNVNSDDDAAKTFCCDSCVALTGGGDKPRRLAKVKLQRSCPLCRSGLQGGFMATAVPAGNVGADVKNNNGEGDKNGSDVMFDDEDLVWVHVSCAQANDAVKIDKGRRRADISGIPLDRTELMCELCGKGDTLGCITCECKKAAFHPTCALVLGAQNGYEADKCPSCARHAAVLNQRKPFVEALEKFEVISTTEREFLTNVINDGKCDRSPFQSALMRLKAIDRVADKTFLTVMRDLVTFPGERSKEEKVAFAAEYQRITSTGKTPAAAVKLFNRIIPDEDEGRIMAEVAAATLQCNMASARRNRPRFPGFKDSPVLYFDVECFANEAKNVFELSPDSERLTVQLIVRTAARQIEELLLSKIFVVGVAERARTLLASSGALDTFDEASSGSTPKRAASKKRRKSATNSGRKNGVAASADENGDDDSNIKDEDDISLFKLEGYEVRMTNQTAYGVFSRIGKELEHNATVEPYLNGKWNKAPYPRRPYEEISEYAPTPGLSASEQQEVLGILETTKRPECDQSDLCAKVVPFDLARNCFETSARCMSRRVGCPRTAVGSHQPLKMGQQVQVTDMWGLDCYTRRNVQTVLRMAAGFETEQLQRNFLQRILLPAIDAQPSHRAHNLVNAMRSILHAVGKEPSNTPNDGATSSSTTQESRPPVPLDDIPTFESDYTPDDRPEVSSKVAQIVTKAIATTSDLTIGRVRSGAICLLFAVRNWGLNAFRVHPKGVGVQCIKDGGLPSGTFVTEYLGELFAPWRWFEKQDAIKNAQKKCRFKPILPDFYNIMMERHEDDEEGYDVAYIDPIVRGNYASRLSHSCEPNCATVVMVVDGHYVVTVYTLRDIGFGEELTFDYSSVTEDENEFKAATCLCGSLGCRGSFLYYAGVGAFAQVLADEQTFLHRNALVYQACADPVLKPEDESRLARSGIKKAALRDSPSWLAKWTSLVLAYAERERDELAHRLCLTTFRDRLTYTDQQARLQAAGVLENRVQNVVITLNKLRHFFTAERATGSSSRDSVGIGSMPLSEIPSPVRKLTPEELVDILWAWDDSHAQVAINGFLRLPVAKDKRYSSQVAQVTTMQKKLASGSVTNYDQVRGCLLELRNVFWSVPVCQCTSAGDLLTWILHTKHFFTAVTYPGMRSTKIVVRNVDIGRDGSVVGSTQPNKSLTKSPAKSPAAVEAAITAKAAKEQTQVRCKRVKRSSKSGQPASVEGEDSLWMAVAPETITAPTAAVASPPEHKLGFEPSHRTPGPLLLPYWYGVERNGTVVLSAAESDNFTSISFEIDAGKPYLRSLKLAAEDLKESATAQKYFVLTIPMPGCIPVYIYRPMLAGPIPGASLSPVEENAKVMMSTTRLVVDSPIRPNPVDGIRWENIGLVYAFDVPLPGTDQFSALDQEGCLITLYAFSEETFSNRVRFLQPGETFHNKASSPQTTAIPKAIDPLEAVLEEEKKYQSGYIWGQMSGWFKQTVASPDASLSAERRGTLSLPDMQCCFSATSYKDRQAIVDRVSKQPEAMWPTGSHWSFKNKRKIYGSPWLDDIVEPELHHTDAILQAMEFHMQHKVPPPPSAFNKDAAMA